MMKGYVTPVMAATTDLLDWQESVITRTNVPPGAPAIGDRYLITAVAAGAWAGHEDEIAEWRGAWIFIVPDEGTFVWVNDEGKLYLYTGGAWEIYYLTAIPINPALDDTAAILNASAAGQTFWLKNGNHILTANINIVEDGITIIGDKGAVISGAGGGYTLTINAADFTGRGLNILAESQGGITYGAAARNTILENINITGDNSGGVTTNAILVPTATTGFHTLNNIYVSGDWDGMGLSIGGAAHYFTFTKCFFDEEANIGAAGAGNLNNVIFNSCTFLSDILIQGASSTGNTFDECIFVVGTGWAAGMDIGGSAKITNSVFYHTNATLIYSIYNATMTTVTLTVMNNTFYSVRGFIRINNGIACVISGNEFSTSCTAASTYCIYLSTCPDSIVSGNELYLSGAIHTGLYVIRTNGKNIQIVNNIIDGEAITTILTVAPISSQEATEGVIISGNIIKSDVNTKGFENGIYSTTPISIITDNIILNTPKATGKGIELDSGENSVIDNNIITTYASAATGEGITLSNGNSHISICGNYIMTTQYGIRIAGTTDSLIVSENIIYGTSTAATLIAIYLSGAVTKSIISKNILDGTNILTATQTGISTAGTCSYLEITENVFNGGATKGFSKGIYNQAAFTQIKNNTIDYCAHLANNQMQIQNSGADCIISGNILTARTHGININANSSVRCKIENNKITQIETAIQCSDVNISIQANTIVDAAGTGITIYANNAPYCNISNNIIIRSGTNNTHVINLAGASAGAIVSNNKIDVTGMTGNITGGLIYSGTNVNHTIKGNSMTGAAARSTTYGIYTGAGAIVEGNNLLLIGESGQQAILVGAESRVSGNRIESTRSNGIVISSGKCIACENWIVNYTDIAIAGIYDNGGDNNIVTDNFIDTSIGGPAGAAFNFTGAIDRTIVKNNIYKDGSGTTVMPVGAGNIIADNIVVP